MTLLFGVTFLTAVVTWRILRHAAASTRVDIGPMPFASLALATVIALCATSHSAAAAAALPGAIGLAGIFALALGDLRTGYLFDRAIVFICAILLALAIGNGSAFRSLVSGLLVAMPLGALFLITRGRGLGLGDVKLAMPIGMALGVSTGLVALGAAFVLGAGAGLVLLARGRLESSIVPFGPFLATGAAVAVPLVQAYR